MMVTITDNNNEPILQGAVKGWAVPGTPGFIPSTDLPPRSGLEWAKVFGSMEQPQAPAPNTPEI